MPSGSRARGQLSTPIRLSGRFGSASVPACWRTRCGRSGRMKAESQREASMANMNNFVKQAQALQANMQKVQSEIASLEVTGEAGGGMVKVIMTRRHELRYVQIEPNVAP